MLNNTMGEARQTGPLQLYTALKPPEQLHIHLKGLDL